ncbi:hypothetical protein H5410_050864 [Solanum commersonii]|uniref:Uncharacterized protein n=1 Tax=Solanum commersonii TaxID=4109 RepID=A0A9J5WYB9_SOLCO|nr:hypothetical protein H5410_050864 [Solanum commersonii]
MVALHTAEGVSETILYHYSMEIFMDGGEIKMMDYVIGEDLDIWSVILDGPDEVNRVSACLDDKVI